jgi:hypothetical protein
VEVPPEAEELPAPPLLPAESLFAPPDTLTTIPDSQRAPTPKDSAAAPAKPDTAAFPPKTSS